jgi:hypothetical protein
VTPEPDHEADTRILELIRTHDARESAVLAAYQRLVDESVDEGIRYLGRLILDDEQRHHQILGQMAERVGSWIRGDNDAGTPALTPRVNRELLDETRRLIALERADAKELRRVQKELRYAPATSMLPLLVKLMLHDNAKHIEILQFIRTYVG